MQKGYLEFKGIPIRKSWGQNFIIDKNIINKIISLINPNKNDTIIEIGPGHGALTIPIAKKSRKVHAIEIDPHLINLLNKSKANNIKLYNENILDWEYTKSDSDTNIIIIGNLPYYITSPIIFKFLNERYWDKMIIMVQKEVAQRIISKSSTKDYSRISVMCQSFLKVKLEFNISKNVFIPKPEVESSILTLYKKKTNIDINEFSLFIKQCFSKRRKTLKNNLKNYIDIKYLNGYENKRAEEVSVDEFIKIFNKIYI